MTTCTLTKTCIYYTGNCNPDVCGYLTEQLEEYKRQGQTIPKEKLNNLEKNLKGGWKKVWEGWL